MTTQPPERWQWCSQLDDLVFDALALGKATELLAGDLPDDMVATTAIRATILATNDKLKEATEMLADDPHTIAREPS